MKRAAIFVWPVTGLLVLTFDATYHALLGAPMDTDTLIWGAVGWLQWMLLGPLVVLLTLRFPWRPTARGLFLAVHLPAPFVFSALHSSIYFTLGTLITGWPGDPGEPLADAWIARLQAHLTLDFLVYSGTVLAVHVVLFLRASWAREEERLALERRIAQAELDLLKLRLPRETVQEKLRDIESAIGRAPRLAEQRIQQFSLFLRQSLAATRAATMADELDGGDVPLALDEQLDGADLNERPSRPWPLPLRFLIVLGAVPGILLVLHAFGVPRALVRGEPIPWQAAWESISLSWFSWPVTLLMVWLASRTRHIALLACAAAAAPLLWDVTFHTALWGWPAARAFLRTSNQPTLDFLIFFAIALCALAWQRYHRWREAARELAELDAHLLRTRAHLLRLQLNPHFLFNTLNSVAALLEDDPEAAREMAARLRELVDRVLTTFDRAEVPLREEIELLANYIAIENVRFGENLQVELRVPESAGAAFVPPLLLQPLVENALRHGLHPATGGRVIVAAHAADGELHLEVRDNGKPRGTMREGIGLSNTRARLRQLYRDACTFDLTRGEDGFRAAIVIPFRTSEAGIA